jgi:hypothetical protein
MNHLEGIGTRSEPTEAKCYSVCLPCAIARHNSAEAILVDRAWGEKQSCPILLGNITIPDEEFSDKDCAFGCSHLSIVGYQKVLNAVFQDVVLPDSANHSGHAILSITVEPRLRSKGVFVDYYHVLGG